MSGLNGTQARTLSVWQNRVRMRVLSKGAGPALVFFHGPWGLHWDPFLDILSQHFTVHAPEHPGTTPGAPDDIYHLDGLWDLILCYDELLEQMGLEDTPSWGIPSAPWLPARWLRAIRAAATAWPSSIPSASGATTPLSPTG